MSFGVSPVNYSDSDSDSGRVGKSKSNRRNDPDMVLDFTLGTIILAKSHVNFLYQIWRQKSRTDCQKMNFMQITASDVFLSFGCRNFSKENQNGCESKAYE